MKPYRPVTLLILSFAALMFLLAAHQSVPHRVIEAERIILRGEDGRQRMVLQSASQSEPLLSIYHTDGTTRLVKLGAMGKLGAYLALSDDKGRNRMQVSATTIGSSIEMIGQDGRPRLMVGTGPGESTELVLFDVQSAKRVSVGLIDRVLTVSIKDKTENDKLQIRLDDAGETILAVPDTRKNRLLLDPGLK